MMFQTENFRPSWSYSDNMTSSFDEAAEYGFGMVADMGSHEFSSLYTTSEVSTDDISFSIPYLATMLRDDYVDFQVHLGEPSVMLSTTNDFSPDLEDLDPMYTGEIEGMPIYLEGNGGSFHFNQSPLDGEVEWNLSQSMNTSDISMDMSSVEPPSLTLPFEGMEIDNQPRLIHLIMAYGEAMQNEQMELAEVIVKRISQTVSPVGEIMERLLYYLFHSLDRQSDYLKLESKKNFHTAYKAFYQIFPNGKFAHFAANSAIMEAMPNDAEVIHVFDFDMGDGVQWSAMIEAIGHQHRELRLTSVKWNTEGDFNFHPSEWKFEETKKRLHDHARSFNLKLKVDETELHDLSEMKKRGDEGEWCAFNCMVSLPHMGRVRRRKDVIEFLRVAKESVAYSSGKGIIAFGDGDAWEKLKFSSSFGPFLDGHLVHYQSLLESLECNFPVHLGEARTAMECLFVAPFVSSLAWFQKWEETRECCNAQSVEFGLEGYKVSKESLLEAKEMVREGESLYGVRTEGDNNNQLVLDWRGTELVRLSCWQI